MTKSIAAGELSYMVVDHIELHPIILATLAVVSAAAAVAWQPDIIGRVTHTTATLYYALSGTSKVMVTIQPA